MPSLKKKLPLVSLFCLSLANVLPGSAYAQDARVLASQTSGIEFAITYPVPILDTTQVGGRPAVQVRFENEAYLANVRGVAVPVLATNVAVPAQAAIGEMQLVSERWLPLRTSLPLAPAIAPSADTLAAWPPAARIADTGWFRDLRLAHLEIVPVRQVQGQLQYLASLTLRLEWLRNPSIREQTPALPATTQELSFYRDAVLNPGDVSRFLRRRTVDLRKAASRSNRDGETFVKIVVRNNGIYRVDGAALAGLGVDLNNINPAELRLYHNGGRELPESLPYVQVAPDSFVAAYPDTLMEIPLILEENGNGRFETTEAIVFAGRSVNDWSYSTTEQSWQHYTNPYATENVYWLSWQPRSSAALRMPAAAPGGSGLPETTGLRLLKIENEIHNPLRSGRDWYGTEFDISTNNNRTYNFNLVSPPTDLPIDVRVRLISRTSGFHTMALAWNGQNFGSTSFFGFPDSDYLSLAQRIASFVTTSGTAGSNTLRLDFSTTNSFGRIYVDWIEVRARDALVPVDGVLEFATPALAGARTYQISGLAASARVIEFSDPLRPRQMVLERSGDVATFSDTLSVFRPKRYLAMNQTAAPERLELYTYSTLRSPQNRADILIVTASDFLDQANRLANHKRTVRGLDVEVVTMATITNEFGWGLLDPSAIRNFVAYAFHFWAKRPRYLILIGDGHYDYRNISTTQRSFIPTYQTNELAELTSRNVEAYFTYVSGAVGDTTDFFMDLAVGRLPVRTPEETANLVDKIITYETNLEQGLWRSVFTMVADDEFGGNGVDKNETFHARDAEDIAENYVPNYMNKRKIYLMSYEGVRTASISGVRKPDAQNDLVKQINDGTLLINYIGHGAAELWADERVFVRSEDFQRIANGKRLPFLVAATCDFGRFDILSDQSFPEDLLAARERGIIATLTSSRLVYAGPNTQFNRQYYRMLFNEGGESMRSLGEALVLARVLVGNRINSEKFTILGDPSLRLALPDRRAVLASLTPDTLFALGKTTLSGQLQSRSGEVASGSGTVEVVVYDDRRPVRYITAAGSEVSYTLAGNLLFRGSTTADNGRFDLSFIVPKDITYGGRNARASFFGYGDQWEAIGHQDRLPISLRSALLLDEDGPEISIAFADREQFASGDPVPQNARLIATIADSISGINVTGEVGHKIILTIDGDVANQLDLTPDFVYFPKSFTSGQVQTVLPDLAPGAHNAELKAWDNSNNSATAYFEFLITERGVLVLQDVLNYPNPFERNTSFTFSLNTEAEVAISIYTVNGRMIQKLEGIFGRPGYNQVPWDGRDRDGDELANGIYLYRIVAHADIDGERKRIEHIGKLAVQR